MCRVWSSTLSRLRYWLDPSQAPTYGTGVNASEWLFDGCDRWSLSNRRQEPREAGMVHLGGSSGQPMVAPGTPR